MNKTISIALIFFNVALFAQKKKNGEIYIKHPSIDVIYQLHDAMNANDSIALDKLIADDFKGVSGEQMNPDAEPQTKEEFIQTVKNLHTNSRYFSVKHTDNGYPDAVEYKDESFTMAHGSTVGNTGLLSGQLQESIIHSPDTHNMS